MPEFVLDLGSPRGNELFDTLSDFVKGYIEAAFFTETGTGDDGDLEDASFDEVAASSFDTIKADCAAFLAKPFSHKRDVESALNIIGERRDYNMTQAGRDFWFTRNGHGVGFWDRDQLPKDIGDRFSDIAREFGERYMYRGDDGYIYFE